ELRRGSARSEAGDAELDDRRDAAGDALEPCALGLEAHEMHLPSGWIEPTDELRHLPLGAAGLDACHQERDRHGARLSHNVHFALLQQAKCHSTSVSEV